MKLKWVYENPMIYENEGHNKTEHTMHCIWCDNFGFPFNAILYLQ